MSGSTLEITWKNSFDYSAGGMAPVDGSIRNREYVQPFAVQGKRMEELFDNIRNLSSGKLYDQLSADDHLNDVLADDVVDAMKRDQGVDVKDFLYGDVIDTSSMLLFGAALRAAKYQPTYTLTVPANAWTDLAFGQRNLDPWGEPPGQGTRGWYEMCTGIAEPELQHKAIGRIALAIFESDFLDEPLEIAFRGNLATAHITR